MDDVNTILPFFFAAIHFLTKPWVSTSGRKTLTS